MRPVEPRPGCARFGDRRHEIGGERPEDLLQLAADERVGGRAEQTFRFFVDVGDAQRVVDDVQAFADRFEDVEALLDVTARDALDAQQPAA